MTDRTIWRGLRVEAQRQLSQREYGNAEGVQRACELPPLTPAGQLITETPDGPRRAAIPGVEVFPRQVFSQPHRGFFGEFARGGEGCLGRIGLWPKQWATARMFSPGAKGFHIHPPHVPEEREPADWFRSLFGEKSSEREAPSRPYDLEQWDVMFIVQGIAEMILVDERAGLPRSIMRLHIFGDSSPGPDNAGIVVPPGVAHAIRTASSEDVIMVYGTSTAFNPAAEGRIAADIESAPLDSRWANYLADPKKGQLA